MSRYIEADAMKKTVEDFPNCYNGWSDTYDKAFIIGAIEEQPSIDIVRCKECKYWEESQYYQEFMACTYVMGATFTRQHDDYCSRGERKESE